MRRDQIRGAVGRFVVWLPMVWNQLLCRILGHRWSALGGPATVAMELDPEGAPDNFTTIAEVKGFRFCTRCGAHALEVFDE